MKRLDKVAVTGVRSRDSELAADSGTVSIKLTKLVNAMAGNFPAIQ